MQSRLPVTVFLLFILSMSLAFADYTEYSQYGNDNGNKRDVHGSTITSFGVQEPAFSSTGSYTEPIVGDLNRDTINDIFLYIGSNRLGLVQGDELGVVRDALTIGEPYITPVLCDVYSNGAGRKEYVSINQQGTNYTLNVITVGDDDELSVISTKYTNITNFYGNMVCSNFHSEDGDNTNYVFWIDSSKQLHKMSMSGASINEVISDPEGAVAKQASGTLSFSRGSHTIIEDDSFSQDDHKTIIFTAGNYLIGVRSDGEEFSYDYYSDHSGIVPFPSTATKQLVLIGGIRTGAPSSSLMISYSQQLRQDSTASEPILLYSEGSSGFPFFDPEFSLDASTTHNGDGNYNSWAYAIHDLDDNGKDEIYQLHLGDLKRLDTSNSALSSLQTTTCALSAGSGGGEQPKMYVLTNGDVIMSRVNASGRFGAICSASGYNTITTIGSLNSSDVGAYTAPVPVDLNNDGAIDFLFTSPARSRFFVTNPSTALQSTHAFSVALNSTSTLTSTQRVTTDFGDPDYEYRYAISCDTSITPVWNEKFGVAYNFTNRNVTFSYTDGITSYIDVDAQPYIEFNNFKFVFGGNISSYDMVKQNNDAVRDYTIIKLRYANTGNNTMDLLLYDEAQQVTDYLEFVKTDNTLSVNKVFINFSVVPVELNTTAITGGYADIEITYIPTTDFSTGQQYYKQTIKVNNVTLVTTESIGTAPFDGTNIMNAELFSFSSNTNTQNLYEWGLSKTHNPNPPFVSFQNAKFIIDGDFTFWIPALIDSITGEGFTVIPGRMDSEQSIGVVNAVNDYLGGVSTWAYVFSQLPGIGIVYASGITAGAYTTAAAQQTFLEDTIIRTTGGNNVFFSTCTYPTSGLYTQRHFMASNTDDWTNYEELRVTVNENTSTTTTPAGGINDPAEDSFTGFFDNLFEMLGVSSTAGKLALTLFLAFAIGIMVFLVTEKSIVFGVLAFVAALIIGFYISSIPLWIIILLVVFAASMVAVAFRLAFNGGG